MSGTATVNSSVLAARKPNDASAAGHAGAERIIQTVLRLLGRDSATDCAIGLFSEAMAYLQATEGDEAVRALFEAFMAIGAAQAQAEGVH